MGRFIGHRGPQEDDWSWEPTSEPQIERGRRRLPLLLAFGAFGAAILMLAGAVLLISGSDNGSADGPPATASASPTKGPATPSPTARPTPFPTRPATPKTPRPSVTPAATATIVPATPAPTPAIPATSAWAWSRVSRTWLSTPLNSQNSDYREGESVPMMLIGDGAVPGETYSIRISYDCAAGGAAAIDFLDSGLPDSILGALTPPGPARSVPDASAQVPNDPSTPVDDLAQRSISLWGATFQSTPSGPEPASPCEGTKRIDLHIRAVLTTIYVVWGAHLAQDTPNGSSSALTPIAVEAKIGSGPTHTVQLDPGAVSR